MISKRRRAVTLPAALLLGLVTLLAGMTAAPAAAAAEAPVDLRAFAPFDVQVVPGQTYDFRMSGQAMTPDTVDGATVRMSMTLPAGVSYVSVGAPCEGAGCRPESGPCEMSGSVLRCVVTDPGAITGAPYQDTAPYQGFYQFTAKLRIGADVPVGTRLAFPVSITGAGEESTPADNTATGRATVVAGADLGLTVEKLTGPAGPRNTVSYTLVVRNYGPSTVPRFGISEGFESFWNSGGTSFDGPNAECITEAVGTTTCVIRQRLAPGQTYRLKRTITVRADDPVWGTRQRVVAGAVDVPENANFTDGHGGAVFHVDFTGTPQEWTPGSTTAPTPGTGAGTGGDGTGGGTGGGDEGGLPVTGSATLPLLAAGVALLLAGAGAVLVTRRRVRVRA